jgi:DNA polymerase-3 subunit delta
MIIKSFEFTKVNLKISKYFLLYGENEGLKDEIIKKIEPNFTKNIYRYDEREIIENKDNFFNGILSKSLFESEKLVIINRSTDKIKIIIEEIIEKKIDDISIILISGLLDKKSKLRNLFEKNKKTICIAFYADTHQTLNMISINYFKNKKIQISQEMINLVVERARGSRQNLNNELSKIENYCTNNNKIDLKKLLKLTNLAENYNVSELTDTCLSKNTKKIVKILNENNLSVDDVMLITRTFLAKTKRLLKLKEQINNNKENIETIVKYYKPPIFWKDMDIVKQQILKWSLKDLKNLIIEINDIELLLKKNATNSINILSDFVLSKSNSPNNEI